MMTQLLQNAVYGTAMILAVMVLRGVLRDRLAPGARLALWAVCLFRLLSPNPPESVLSLWGLFRTAQPQVQAQPAAPAAPAAGVSGGYVPTGVPGTPVPVAEAAVSWETVLPAVWLAVGIGLAVWYAAGWLRTHRAVRCAIPVGKGDPRRRALPGFARLREGPMEGAPLTFGVARPTVVLSPGLEGEELECVLAHEGVHARRRDNVWHYVMAAALAVHWWNPAVWVMSRLLRRDIELSCDRAALKKLGEGRRAEYANALVTLATQGSGPAFCQTFGRKATEERILSIMKFKKTTILGVVLSLVLVLGVTIAFASDPKTDDTVDFHGETFSRAELSQETLDWLDWYLALSEEEQLSISYIPGELRRDPAPETVDAKADEGVEHSSSRRCAVYYDGTMVTRMVIPLEVLEEELDIRLEEKTISPSMAELVLTQAQSIAVDGVIDWTFTKDDGLRHEVLPEKSDEDTTVSANGYWDKDGTFVKVGFTEIVRDFILPQALMGEDEGVTFNLDDYKDYKVHMPVYDEDGNSLVYDENGELAIVGIRTSGVIYDHPCEDENCTAFDGAAHCHTEDGAAMRVYYENPYEKTEGYPVNSKGETYGPNMFDEYGCDPDLVLATGTNGEEGYVRMAEISHYGYPGTVNNPDEAMAYMAWLEGQPAEKLFPLYDCEGVEIGKFSVSNSCHVESEVPICALPLAEDAGAGYYEPDSQSGSGHHSESHHSDRHH